MNMAECSIEEGMQSDSTAYNNTSCGGTCLELSGSLHHCTMRACVAAAKAVSTRA